MAVVEENWQMKRSTVAERTSFIFNNELLSDVNFVVPASSGKVEVMIPAHKFVLAISSPVFFAMFYGQMAETKNSIELPDGGSESLLEMFRFLYTDRVNLNGSNVMQVLYLAEKYMVPSLAEKCTKYLQDNLEASNVFCILPHAQKYEDKDLEDRCWKVIEMETEEALTSGEFVTLDRSVVETLVKRETLNVKEVELFKAVDRWVTKESERQGITPDGEVKRRILGDEIVKAIRFPSMSQKEFLSDVFDSYILTIQEVGDLMKHFNGLPTSPLPFKQGKRIKDEDNPAKIPNDNSTVFLGNLSHAVDTDDILESFGNKKSNVDANFAGRGPQLQERGRGDRDRGDEPNRTDGDRRSKADPQPDQNDYNDRDRYDDDRVSRDRWGPRRYDSGPRERSGYRGYDDGFRDRSGYGRGRGFDDGPRGRDFGPPDRRGDDRDRSDCRGRGSGMRSDRGDRSEMLNVNDSERGGDRGVRRKKETR